MYKIAKENLSALFQLMAAERDIFAPVNNGGQVNFEAWAEGAESLLRAKYIKAFPDSYCANDRFFDVNLPVNGFVETVEGYLA